MIILDERPLIIAIIFELSKVFKIGDTVVFIYIFFINVVFVEK